MNGTYTTTCESCDSEIVRNGGVPLDVSNISVIIPTDERETFEERDYGLCSECRRKIVDFIEGMDETETRADLVELELAERDLSQRADELQGLATKLGALARGDAEEGDE